MVNLKLKNAESQIEKLVLEAIALIEDEASFNMVEDKGREIPIAAILDYVESRLGGFKNLH